ncbi:MAG: hypothetical protein ACI8RZ_007229 [Myxococcota bacterium]
MSAAPSASAARRSVSRVAASSGYSWGVLLLLLSCGPDPDPAPVDTSDTEETAPILLSGADLLIRLSLDLRGVRPSLAELAAAEDDPDTVETLIDEMLSDPRFYARMGWLWNDTLHTGVWSGSVDRFEQYDAGWDYDDWRSVGLEPVKMVELILAEDLPLSALVTHDSLPANDTLAVLWESSASGSEWSWGHYTDGRPMAGLLSSKTLWMRYNADATNYNRQRANAVASIFLCADFFDRAGSFAFTLDGELTDIESAVATVPACTTCHAALDPLAAFFGGFSEQSVNLPAEQFLAYSPLMADWYAIQTAPAYFGHPGRDVIDLGAMIAVDPRFSSCMAERFYEGLVGSALPLGGERDALVDTLNDAGLRGVPLIEAVVTSDAYRAAGPKVLSTDQLYTALTDLTGWQPQATNELEGLDALQWSAEHRVMGGGTDDVEVLYRSGGISLSGVVLMEWVGRQSTLAIDADLAKPSGVLFPDGLPADDAAAEALIATWVGRFLSRPDDEDITTGLHALWQDAGGLAGGSASWAVVLQAVIRHPAGLVY